MKTKMKVVMPGVQTRYSSEEEQVILRAIRELPTFTQGTELENFEKEFANYIGIPGAVGVCNGTAALELSAILSGTGPGDEVVIPAHTFVASAIPFARRGAKLVFADIDPETRLISAQTILPCLSKKTKLVVVVHLYGLMAEMESIMELSKKYRFVIVEDCAQAPGAVQKEKKAGSIADYGCFSFHTNKNITTFGEGGMLTLRDPEKINIVKKLRWLGNWPFEGKRERYWLPAMNDLVPALEGEWPHNFCLSEIQAVLGRLLLRKLDFINEKRRKQAEFFRQALSNYSEISFQRVEEKNSHVYHLLSARYEGDRDALIELLWKEYEIKCIVQYWPLYRSELFKKFGYTNIYCPNAEYFFDHMISFPWWSDMPLEILEYMTTAVQESIVQLREKR